ncbi:MAG: hypothetical protein A2Z14_11505 [Chloroflexi bacterium RBG_16_48_8]|nr:MAG: hypothetical protein A2Z14_11505 [Chloroflexi bacterium RBG_16_48_8]
MRRPPFGLYLATILGLISAILLIWEGLYICLFTGFRNPDALWLQWTVKLGINPFGLAWPWIVLGISWVSALCGIWVKLPWGRWVLWIVCILSLLYLEMGTILAAFVLIAIALPMSQRWIKESHVSEKG